MPVWVSSPLHREIIAALVEARRERGMTQRDVAKSLGKTPSFVGKVEAIERNLSILEFVAWTAVLDVDPAKIIPEFSTPPLI